MGGLPRRHRIWSTSHGTDWKLETANAQWSKRRDAQVVVFDDRLWMMGGGHWMPENVPRNDVWCSDDGMAWTQITETAPWRPRMWFSLVTYRDSRWVLGGWSKADGNFADVWYSGDGRNWTELKSNVIRKNRHAHSAYVFKDRIWLAGGHAEPVNSEVWSLEIPETVSDAEDDA